MNKQLRRTTSLLSGITAAVLSLTSILTPVNAAVMVFSDQASWEAALSGGTITTDTINYTASTSITDSIVLTDVGVTFNVTEGVRNDLGDISFSGNNLRMRVDPDDANDPQEITGVFSGLGVHSFGFNFGAINNPNALTRAHLEVLGQNYDLYSLRNNGTNPGSGSGFVGIISTTELLTSFSFNNGPFTSGQDDILIDNFKIVSLPVSVPEPTSVLLLGLGLVGFGLSRKQKKS